MLLIFLLVIFTAPVRLRIDLLYRQGLSGRVVLSVWGVAQTVSFQIKNGQLLLPGREPRPMRAEPEQGKKLLTALGTFLRAEKGRGLLTRYVRLEELRAALRLSLQDAAGTALLSGGVRTLYGLIPANARRKIRLQVMPDFLSQGTQGKVRCILSSHLGILVITAAMFLWAWLGERKEHGKAREEEA